jgi:hypothetical protein
MIVGEWHEEFKEALDSADGLYDYLSVVIIKHNGANVKKTEEVAREYGALLAHYWPKWDKPFIDDFSAPRNMTIKQLPEDCDWVFVLDSDDRIADPTLARSIIISQERDTIVLAKVQSLDEYGSFMQYRAFPRGTGKYVGRIHNQYVPDFMHNAKYTPELVVYYTNRPFPHRKERNLAILRDIEATTGLNASDLFYMGEMLYLEDLKANKVPSDKSNEGVEWFNKSLAHPELSDTIRYNCNYFLAEYYILKGIAEKSDFEPAITHVLELLGMSTFLRDPYYLMGRIQTAAGNFQHAVWWLKHAVEMPEEVVLWHISANIRAHAMEQLAMCFLALGQNDLGMRYHAQARYLDKNLVGTDTVYEKHKLHQFPGPTE